MIDLKNTVVTISPKHTIEAVEGLQRTPIGFVRTYLVNQVILEAEFTVRNDNTISVDKNSLLGTIYSVGYLLDIFGSKEGEVNVVDLSIDTRLNALGLESMDTKTIHDIYKFLNCSLLSLKVESK